MQWIPAATTNLEGTWLFMASAIDSNHIQLQFTFRSEELQRALAATRIMSDM